MSKGGFTGKGIFATLPYLVVVYEDEKDVFDQIMAIKPMFLVEDYN